MPRTKKIEQDYAENGTTERPKNDVAHLLNEVSAWGDQPPIKDEDDAEKRLAEYFNMCVLKGEMPMFETMCLYLGVSDTKGIEYANGENCSVRMQKLFQYALTKLKAVEGKAAYKGKIRDVPYIWRSKQYFGYKEPNKLEDLLAGNILKELPSAASVAQKYMLDVEETAETDTDQETDQ